MTTRLTIKSPTLGITSTNHAVRAMISQGPVKRVSVPETATPPERFPSTSASFIPLTLPTREETLNDSEVACCYPQPYHTILPSPNRYETGKVLSQGRGQ